MNRNRKPSDKAKIKTYIKGKNIFFINVFILPHLHPEMQLLKLI